MHEPTCVIEDITDHPEVSNSDREAAGGSSGGGCVDADERARAAAPTQQQQAQRKAGEAAAVGDAATTATAAAASRQGSPMSDSDKQPDQSTATGSPPQDEQRQEEEQLAECANQSAQPGGEAGAAAGDQEQQQEQPAPAEQQQQQQQQQQAPAAPPPAWAPSTDEERAALASAEALKAEGNALYGRDAPEEALAKYAAALAAAPEAAAPLRAVIFANMAACCLKLSQPQLAAEHCSCALRAEPAYVKALMRRAAAFEAMDDPEHALADARRVLELDASSHWAAAAVRRLEPAAKAKQEALKEEMMRKLKDLGNTLLGKFGLSLDNFKAEQDPATGGYSIKFQR